MRKSDHYIDTGAKDLRKKRDEFYAQNYPLNAPMWQQGTIDKRFKSGDQGIYNFLYSSDSLNQRRWYFNKIRKHCNMITGHQRKHRKSTVAIGLHADRDDPLADDLNTVIRWTEDRDGTQEYISQAFEGAVDVGISLLHLYLDYGSDPICGDFCLDNLSYNNFLIDGFFRKRDLSDCSGIWMRRWVTKQEAMILLPGREDELGKMSPCGLKDGRFSFQAELLNLNTSQLYSYDEFYYQSFREATIIIDPKTDDSTEWLEEEGQEEDELERILALQPWLIVKKIQKPTVKLFITLNDRPVYDGPNLLGIDPYPFVPVLCYYEPDLPSYQWRVQGVPRGMRDIQFLYNRRKVIELQALESTINAGWAYKVDMITDPKALRQSGGGEAFLIPVKGGPDFGINDAVQRIQPPQLPDSNFVVTEGLNKDMTDVTGINEELLGSADDDKAGILAMMRQGAALTTLHGIFDGLDFAQKQLGRIRMQAIQKNFTKNKVARILGREPVERFFSGSALKYDITTEEGFYSTTQRQMELKQLLYFRELGMPISDSRIMQAAIISNKKEIIEEMKQTSLQQQQQQQAQGEQEQQQAQAEIMVKYAKSRSDLAAAKEKMASASQKIVQMDEIQASAEHKRTQADLDIVQQMIALEDLDRKSLREALDLADIISQKQNQVYQPRIMS
jgi:hypothetical protein